MPYFEIRLLKQLEPKFDIYYQADDMNDNEDTNHDGVNWDNYLVIDYNKLNQYI